tara:strand:+ start:14178 stop:14837 length:660 start_codon:yes stop_codon:yes gene_type:complete
MISSQIGSLDRILSDGIKNGMITEISGLRGTGKTHLALQFAIEPLSKNERVFFIDTTVEFRPERFLEILQSRNLSNELMKNLNVSHVTNIQQQIDILSNIENQDLSILIIDNISDLFSFEFTDKQQLMNKNNYFSAYILHLSRISLLKNIPIVITNQVLNKNENYYRRMDDLLENHIHQRIELEKIKNKYFGIIKSPFVDQQSFDYKITKLGIEETQSI